MTVALFQSVGAIKITDSSHGNLSLHSDPNNDQNWKNYPLSIAKHEMEVSDFDFNRVLVIIQGNSKAPSELANIPRDKLCALGQQIDTVYRQSISDYQVRLIKATQEDVALNTKVATEHKNTHLKAGGGGALVAGGIGAAIGAPFGGPVGAGVGGGIGLLAGFIIGIVTGDKARKTIIVVRSSANRVHCLKQIDTLEKERIKEAVKRVDLRIKVLARNLSELQANNQTDVGSEKERQQLLNIKNYLV